MPGTRTLVIIGAFVAVCGLGAAGWMRKNDRPADGALLVPSAYPADTTYSAGNAPYPASQSAYNPGGSVPQPVYASDGYYPSRMRPIYVRQPEAPPAVVVETAPRRVYQEQEYYTDSHGRRRGRSKTHSVEIVAGTAAAGAAIGALAGGGKGAAIGAISGGGAGFVYDRLTHNK
jgi:hypothetical protein